MVKKITIPIFFCLVLILKTGWTQSDICAGSLPFCTGMELTYAAGTSGNAEPGAYYACLSSQPAPAWFHMAVEDPGNITIYIYSSPLRDIDFICWGPFSDSYSPCVEGLTASKTVDCSYSPNPTEFCDIPDAQTGQFYILMITNYSQMPTQITFEQSSGAGSLDCDLVTGLVPAFSAEPLSGMAPLTVQFTDKSVGHPLEYKWDFQNDGIYDAFDSLAEFTYNDPGIYSVKLWVQNEYESDSVVYDELVSVDTLTRIAEHSFLSHEDPVKIYPNPVSDHLYLDFGLLDELPQEIEICSITGVRFPEFNMEKCNANTLRINLESLPKGFYFIKLSLSNKVINKSFLVLK